MTTVDELKQELSDLFRKIFLLLDGKQIDEPINVPILQTAMTHRFLSDELRKLDATVPPATHIQIDWSKVDQDPLSLYVTRRWVTAVATPLLPMARALEAELRSRQEQFAGDTLTADMLKALQDRFNN